MKHPISKSIQTACASLALILTLPSLAQQPAIPEAPPPEDKGATSEGTISALDTSLITVTPSDSAQPIRFTYSKGTKYVDELGIDVSVTSLKPGVPVTVYYAAVGDSMVANKIVVKRTSKVPNAISDTTLVTAMGTISEFGPERLVVSTDSSAEPFSYMVSKKTTFVDEAGKVVTTESIKSGIPVTVHYTKADGKFIASKVIVRKAGGTPPPLTETTTTTTTMGTISEVAPGAVVIRSEEAPHPVRYKFTKTTTYVDESGAPVSIKTVKSGLPVTVHYTTEGETRVATKVVVRKKTTTVEPK